MFRYIIYTLFLVSLLWATMTSATPLGRSSKNQYAGLMVKGGPLYKRCKDDHIVDLIANKGLADPCGIKDDDTLKGYDGEFYRREFDCKGNVGDNGKQTFKLVLEIKNVASTDYGPNITCKVQKVYPDGTAESFVKNIFHQADPDNPIEVDRESIAYEDGSQTIQKISSTCDSSRTILNLKAKGKESYNFEHDGTKLRDVSLKSLMKAMQCKVEVAGIGGTANKQKRNRRIDQRRRQSRQRNRNVR